MEYSQREFVLKNGKICLIRRPKAEDAERIVRYQRESSGETPYLIVGPEDITQTIEEQAERIERWNASPCQLRLMAAVEGELAGVAIVYGSGFQRRLRHRCTVDITLYQKFCGIGIGTVLLEELLKAAAVAGYEQAELEVVSANTPAIALYQKLGFKETGVVPCALKYADGSFADFLLMVKPLNSGTAGEIQRNNP